MAQSTKDNVNYRELVREMERLEEKLDKTYVKLIEFEPVKRLVFGTVSILLTAVVIALVALVIQK